MIKNCVLISTTVEWCLYKGSPNKTAINIHAYLPLLFNYLCSESDSKYKPRSIHS